VINLEGKHTLFGTSGIRGLADKLFTEQFCYDISRAFILFLKKHNLMGPVAIGMDPRSSSPEIKKKLINGLSLEKVKIHDEGVAPIPSINWLIKNTPVKAAIMITGSHIAPDRNGLKFYAHDEEISVKDQKEIEEIYLSLKKNKKIIPTTPILSTNNKARKLYTELLLKLANKNYPTWKVAIDCANGAQSTVIPPFLETLGFQIIKVNCNPQDTFIARDTDTSDKAEIEKLIKTVVNQKCDLGIAFDGDGDRVVFIDEKGNFVLGEYSCGLVAKASPGDIIVTPISSSSVVDSLGKKVIRTKVGSPYVIEKMKETGAIFGFEPNGGAISGEIMYTRDGGTMLVKMLNLFAESNGTFSQMINQLPKFYMQRTKVDYKWELQESILKKVKKEFKGKKTEEIDGLKIWLDDTTWILFRSSQNAPEFRVFAESNSNEKAQKLLKKGMSLVQNMIS